MVGLESVMVNSTGCFLPQKVINRVIGVLVALAKDSSFQ
jgi:hypothetical protein